MGDSFTDREITEAIAAAARRIRACGVPAAEVEGLADEAVMRAILVAGTQAVADLKALSAKIARHVALDWFRRERSRAKVKTTPDPAELELHAESVVGVGSGLPDVTAESLKALLASSFPRLSPADLRLLMLRHWEGLSARQVAERLGSTLDAAKKNLAAAEKIRTRGGAERTKRLAAGF